MGRSVKATGLRIWIVCALPLICIAASFLYFGLQIRQTGMDHALILSIQKGDAQAAIQLLNQGANANAQDKPWKPVTFKSLLADALFRLRGGKPVKDTNHYSSTIALWYARKPGAIPENIPLMQALIAHGADVNGRDLEQISVLVYATLSRHIQTVKLLLENHADPNIRDPDSQTTPVFYASPQIAELLIAHGATVDARDSSGRTPLWNADVNGIVTAKLLVAHGANVNARDNDGDTPLLSAAYSNDVELTQLLYTHGAKIDARDNAGCTALIQSIHGSYNIVKGVKEIHWLIQHGAKVDDKDKYGQTVIHYTDNLYFSDKAWLRQILQTQLRKERRSRSLR